MKDTIRRRAAILLFMLLCLTGAACSVWRVVGWGNALSDVDAFSEANALREVRNFRERGLAYHYGLGNVYYRGLYPDDGYEGETADRRRGVSAEGVYTHYPPGAEYLLYAATRVLGSEPVSRLRLLPIALGAAATLFLGFSLRRRFGATVGWIVMGACALTPAATDGFVGLHYQGTAFALLLFEIGLALGLGTATAPFALLGFLQGWLSFDYAFLVTATPLAIEAVMPRIDPGHQRRWRLGFLRALLAGGGFAAAHALHLLQVWAYWGSVAAMLGDIAAAAAHRSGAGMIGGPLDYLYEAMSTLKTYYVGFHPFHGALGPPEGEPLESWSMFRFLGLSLGPWWLAVTSALMVWGRMRPQSEANALRMDWHFVSLTGLLTSSLWLVVMPNHAGYHRHFLYRHLFFAFFVLVLFGAVAVAVGGRRARGEGREARRA